jgi:hypothetical protein
MWKRRTRVSEQPDHEDTRLGVGAQVYVVDDPKVHPDGWVGDPTGVIVSSGSAIAYGAVSVISQRVPAWVVVFDEPQYRADGKGPFDRAEIAASLLVAAPGVVDSER